MNEAQVRTLQQLREVLTATQALTLRPAEDDTGRYAWIETVLRRIDGAIHRQPVNQRATAGKLS